MYFPDIPLHRIIQPEILDSLPAAHPEAVRSRADLRLINRLMGNHRWFERLLAGQARSRDDLKIVELGAGDGCLARRLCRRFPGIRYEAVDLMPRPVDFPAAALWHQADLFDALPCLRGDVVIANLFLHHFDAEALARIGAGLEGFPIIACCEPWRKQIFHGAGLALRLLGINRVTRHDLHVSINAGFTGWELPRLLGLEGGRVERSALGAYRWTRRR